jgi:hypothetical protein
MSSSKTTFPPLSCVICPPPLFRPDGPFPVSSSTHHLPRVPFPPRQPLTKLHLPHLFSCLLRLYPFCLMSSPAASLTSHRSYFAPALWPHHSVAEPHFPRWPPYPSFKLFSYSRWQREESSISQSAELARSSSIPRKQLLKRLVVVRHRLRHNGKSCNELKARRFADETVRRSIASAISCTTIQRLRLQKCQKPCRRKAFNAVSWFRCCCCFEYM